MSKWLFLVITLPLLGGLVVARGVQADAEKAKRDLLGTWDCLLPDEAPGEVRHQKLITPGRYIWVTFDKDQRQVLALAGGTWALDGPHYAESCEFASNTHQHLRGKRHRFECIVKDLKWGHKSAPGTEIQVDEVWNKVDEEDRDPAGPKRPGAELQGAWEGPSFQQSPALRILKYVTFGHWSWVIFDRENKMVLAAMGGTWLVRDGKYEETVQFATDNCAQMRGHSYSYGFEVRDAKWLLRRGPELEGAREEVWRRAAS
jgi:hypothetical protein